MCCLVVTLHIRIISHQSDMLCWSSPLLSQGWHTSTPGGFNLHPSTSSTLSRYQYSPRNWPTKLVVWSSLVVMSDCWTVSTVGWDCPRVASPVFSETKTYGPSGVWLLTCVIFRTICSSIPEVSLELTSFLCRKSIIEMYCTLSSLPTLYYLFNILLELVSEFKIYEHRYLTSFLTLWIRNHSTFNSVSS